MAQQSQQEAQGPQQPPGVSAPAIAASNRVSVTIQPTDILLSMGITRLAYDSQGHQVGTAVQYVGSYSLSPTTAKQLSEILRISLAKYEEAWGAIPMDKETLARLHAIAQDPLVRPVARKAAKKVAKTVRAKR